VNTVTEQEHTMNQIPEWLQTVLIETNKAYSKGESDYSTTQLIKPPMIVRLEKENDVVVDPVDYLSSFTGTSVHNQIEKMLKDDSRYIVEERMFAKIGGYTISGQIDLYIKDTKRLLDHKNTSVYKINSGDHFDYEAQLNINRWLMHQNSYVVESLGISAFPQDWRTAEAKRDQNYPQIRYHEIEIPVWTLEKTEEFIRERIALHTAEQVEVCTPEERWRSNDVYAVMRSGRKSAVKLHQTEVDALKHLVELGSKTYYLDKRDGYDRRCHEYCKVNEFCPYFKSLVPEVTF